MTLKHLFCLVIALTFSWTARAETTVVSFPKNRILDTDVLIQKPASTPKGLLVLLPGGGGNIRTFEQSGFAADLRKQGIVTLTAAPKNFVLYAKDDVLAELGAVISQALQDLKIPDRKFIIGGFSAGGIGSARYTQYAMSKASDAAPVPRAVFIVDACLDFARWHQATTLHLKRTSKAGMDTSEDTFAIKSLEAEMGGPPSELPDVYKKQSVVSVFDPDGGNALTLLKIPIRLYTEPDLGWRVPHWKHDFFNCHLTDMSTLAQILTLAGHKEVELIITTGKGYRPDGSRNPHSWSIVDEPDLVKWIGRWF